jgi:Protein of unknown function (DUF2909)
MKILVGLAFIAIVAALLYAGISMVRDGRDGRAKTPTMMRALAWRVGISVTLFLCLLLSYKLGWIQPTGIPRG